MADENLHFEGNLRAITCFSDLGLNKSLQNGMLQRGFESPFGVQKRALLPIINKTNVVIDAPDRSGRSTTIAIAVCHFISSNTPGGSGPRALVLLPTSKSASHMEELIKAVGAHSRINVCNVDRRNRMIKRGVVLGSPDHVLDTFEKQPLMPMSIRLLVLDCCDHIIENDHSIKLKGILRCLSPKIRLLMISKTDVPGVAEILDFMGLSDALVIRSKTDVPGVAEILDFMGLSDALVIRAYRRPVSVMEGIRHFFVREHKEKPKYHVLLDLFRSFTFPKVIVFRNSNSQVTRLRKKMQESNFEVLEIKGDTPADERQRRMEELRFKKFLITTDALAAELVDEEVLLVINYDIPVHARHYVHRTGWCGRFSSQVTVINFVGEKDKKMVRQIEQIYKIKIDQMPPNVHDATVNDQGD